jgi:hypothetical protein
VKPAPRSPSPSAQEELRPEDRYVFSEGAEFAGIPPAPAVWSLGGLALVVATAAWLPFMGWLAWIDLPINFLLFLGAAWVSLTDRRATMRAMPGLVAGVAAVLVSTVNLLFSHVHPWTS